MNAEDYERLRRPLLDALAQAQQQFERNVAPIREQLARLAGLLPPAPVFYTSHLTAEDLAKIAALPHVVELTTQAHNLVLGHGLTPAELACAGPTFQPNADLTYTPCTCDTTWPCPRHG